MSISSKDMVKMCVTNTPGTTGTFVLTPIALFNSLGSSENGLIFNIRVFDSSGNWNIYLNNTWTNSSSTLSGGTFSSSSSGSPISWSSGVTVTVELTTSQINSFLTQAPVDYVSITLAGGV